MAAYSSVRWTRAATKLMPSHGPSQYVRKFNILPANHFGARPGRTTSDSINLLTKTVKDAWWKGQVASILFLDIKSAFPSVDINRLVHNMKKRGIPVQYMDWLQRQLGDRLTMLIFDDFQSDLFIVLNGLDQGDPFSGILYLLYNSDLLKIPKTQQRETMLLFVDNAAIIIRGNNFAETHTKLQDIMQRHDGSIGLTNTTTNLASTNSSC